MISGPVPTTGRSAEPPVPRQRPFGDLGRAGDWAGSGGHQRNARSLGDRPFVPEVGDRLRRRDATGPATSACLARVQAVAPQIDAAMHDYVDTLRARGVSWTRIGAALGVSKQAAWERFSGED